MQPGNDNVIVAERNSERFVELVRFERLSVDALSQRSGANR